MGDPGREQRSEQGIPKLVLLGVGVIALCSLLLEVNITRIFSVTLWYYFGFLAISLALLGTAAAGVLCYIFPDRLAGPNHKHNLAVFAFLFAAVTPLAITVHLSVDLSHYDVFDARFFLILSAQLLLLFTAFFCAGMCITIALFRYGSQIGTVYFSDLVGASLGSLAVVPLLYHFSAPSITYLVSTGACGAGFLFLKGRDRSRLRGLLAVVALVFLVLFFTNDRLGLLRIRTVKSFAAGSAQQHEDSRVFEKWSPISRVAVFAPQTFTVLDNPYEAMLVTNDAAAPTGLYRFDGDLSKMGFLRWDSRQTVHRLQDGGEVLIIGSAGGVDVLASLLFGRERITAVEINPVTVEIVSRTYADYIGRLFDNPAVTLYLAEGRNFVAGSEDLYDAIQITMIDSWSAAAAGAYVFNENSLYTLQAVRDYVRHLKPDGILSMTRYYEWDEVLRLTNMFIEHLRGEGVTDAEKRLIVVTEPRSNYRRTTVLLKNGVFTPEETSTVLTLSRQYGFPLIYAPSVDEEHLEPSEYSRMFRSFIDPHGHGLASRDEVIGDYPRDVSPPTDDRPFFFFTRYFRDTFQFDPSEHPSRRIALPLLYGMFVFFGLVGLFTLFLPLYLSRRAEIRNAPYRLRSLTYFVGLGVGFILIEISLIQRLTIFLGHPTYSFVVVLTTLLCASGLGSFLSGVWATGPSPRKLLLVLAGIILMVLLYIAFVYDAFTSLMWLDKPWRILLAVAAIAPPGFLMGMCFPMGMQIVREFHVHLIPWGWGVNGAFSVFASVFSLVLALNFGFKVMMAVGVASYALSLLVVFSLRGSVRQQGTFGAALPTEEVHN